MPLSTVMTHGNWIPSLLAPRLIGIPGFAKAEPYVFAGNADIINIGGKVGASDAAGCVPAGGAMVAWCQTLSCS